MFSRRWATHEVPEISIMFGECYGSQDWATAIDVAPGPHCGRRGGGRRWNRNCPGPAASSCSSRMRRTAEGRSRACGVA